MRVIVHPEHACNMTQNTGKTLVRHPRKHTEPLRDQWKLRDGTDLRVTDTIRQWQHTKNQTYHMQSIAVDDAVLLHEIPGYCDRGKIQALGGKLRRKFISLCRQLVTKALKGEQYICHAQWGVWLGRGGNGWDFKLLVPKARRMERLLEKDRTRQTVLGHTGLSSLLHTWIPNLSFFSKANSIITNKILKYHMLNGSVDHSD